MFLIVLSFEFYAYVLFFMAWALVVEVVVPIAAGCFRWTLKSSLDCCCVAVSNILSTFRQSDLRVIYILEYMDFNNAVGTMKP